MNSLPSIYSDDFSKKLTVVQTELSKILKNKPEETKVSSIPVILGSLVLNKFLPKFPHPVVVSAAIYGIAREVLVITKFLLQFNDIDTLKGKLAGCKEQLSSQGLHSFSAENLKSDVKKLNESFNDIRTVLKKKENTITWNLISRVFKVASFIILSVGVMTKVAPLFLAGCAFYVISYLISRHSIKKVEAAGALRTLEAFKVISEITRNNEKAIGYAQMSERYYYNPVQQSAPQTYQNNPFAQQPQQGYPQQGDSVIPGGAVPQYQQWVPQVDSFHNQPSAPPVDSFNYQPASQVDPLQTLTPVYQRGNSSHQ